MSYWERMKSSSWAYPTAVLSLYGFFANFRPAEPFLTPYLVGPYKNISEEQVTNYLFPIWTYSYLAVLCPVFLLTDFLRYKPVIMVQGLFLVTNYVLLCFAPGLPAMTFLQVNFAVVTSCEVAYFSYIYSVVPAEEYQRVSGYLRSAMLLGFTLGASLGQVLVSLAGMSYFYVNAINLGTVSVAFLLSFCLPMPQRSMFFEGQSHSPQQGGAVDEESAAGGWCNWRAFGQAGELLWRSFRDSYSSRQLVYWALWWALATAGYNQIFNYIQLMWNHIEPSGTSSVYNGGVEAVTSLVGAAAAFSVGHLRLEWAVWGELALGVFSAVSSGAVFLMGLTSSIWVCYAGYVTFKASYMLLITITTFQIAANLSMECYALTFGINTFTALLLQTVITAIVVDESALGSDIVTQFIIYGCYYAAISLLFLVRGSYTASQHHCRPGQASGQDLKEDVAVEVLSSARL
ncbi:solute carrier family 19 member 3b [Megalops cyprinoides]|uniref:solute carrier family 19 member 3b n=1 Tax=Megalops cyprinoides TaxID=118141 RepID=UPI001863D416|nr:solute carrier family 19 member 3b [Megalops cyprinoides]